MVMTTRLNGINPLSYMGVNPYTPAPLIIRPVRPTSNDAQNFFIGTLWVLLPSSGPEEVWMLVSLVAGQATWVQLYPAGGGSGGASEFPCDSGTANEASGVLNVFGGQNIHTTGSGNTVTVATTNDITVPATLTVIGNATFDDEVTVTDFTAGVVQSDALGLLSSTKGGNGELLIGGAGIAPSWQNITSLDSSVTITNGANSIDLSVTQGGEGRDAFMAHQLNTQNYYNWAGSPTFYVPYYMGCGSTVQPAAAMTVLYSNSGAFYPGDGISVPASFTAPATGSYYFSFVLLFSASVPGNTNSFTGVVQSIITPSNTFITTQPRFSPTLSESTWTFNTNALVPLSMGDQVTFTVLSQANNISSQYFYIIGKSGNNPAGAVVTWISGYRVS